MLRFFLNLMGILLFLSFQPAWGWDCASGRNLVVTAPRSGAHTFNDTIAIRGFLCDNYEMVVVKNRTTEKAVLTNTDETCDGERCIYTFALFVTDLAMGVNEIEASIPGQNPPRGVSLQVIRTALVMK